MMLNRVTNLKRIGGVSAFVVAIFLLTGCTVGPNYKTPKTKVPEAFGNSHSGNSSSDSDHFQNWWAGLNDPVLNSLVERAVRANLDLRLAQARVREARAQRGVVKSDLYPDVNAFGSYQRFRASKNTATQGTNVSQSSNNIEGNLYQAGFDASWELDIFGGKRREVEAADAVIAAEIENSRDVLVTLLAEVARNYVDLRAVQQQSAIARSNLDAQKETLELTTTRFDAGLASNLDVSRAEAQVQTTAAQIPTLEINARQLIHLLGVLLGQEPNSLVQELSPSTVIPSTPGIVQAGLPSELLRRRPDIRRAEREIAAATARIGVATADLFPRFSITAAIGLGSGSIGNLANSGSGFWSILPGVSLPIFNRGRIHSNIAVQNAREEQALIAYEQTVLNSLREVEDALIAFSEDQKRRETLASAVDANRRAVELANQLYREGLTDFLSVLQAQRDLFLSEDALAQGDRNVTSDFIALYKVLGGGWENGDAEKSIPVEGKPGARTIDVTARKRK
jgi:outer membrane protein, multidrug efflux system